MHRRGLYRALCIAILTGICLQAGGVFALPNYDMSTWSIQSMGWSTPDTSWKSIRTFPLTQRLKKPLRIYIETPADQRITFKPHYVTYVQKALNTWTQALENRLSYVLVSRPSQAQITVRWTDALSEPDEAGVTDFEVGHADIVLKTKGMPENILQANILHELGHALGLAEHSDENNDIMVGAHEWRNISEYQQYQPHLSRRDVAAIRHLYSNHWQAGQDVYIASDMQSARQLVSRASLNMRFKQPAMLRHPKPSLSKTMRLPAIFDRRFTR